MGKDAQSNTKVILGILDILDNMEIIDLFEILENLEFKDSLDVLDISFNNLNFTFAQNGHSENFRLIRHSANLSFWFGFRILFGFFKA